MQFLVENIFEMIYLKTLNYKFNFAILILQFISNKKAPYKGAFVFKIKLEFYLPTESRCSFFAINCSLVS